MAQGLQCWDGSGRLVVDLSDYNLRFIGTASVTFSPGDTIKNISYADCTEAGTIVAVTGSSMNTPNEYFCRAYNGGVNAFFFPVNGLSVSHSINVEIYKFQ
ncbi:MULTISPECIES: hypothetical protein [unclassified Kosakonia]|uniref:hypothetical protein n=1 Tax=unclassified Kosakonia TaxID=2632876 RepID=UPI0031B73899